MRLEIAEFVDFYYAGGGLNDFIWLNVGRD